MCSRIMASLSSYGPDWEQPRRVLVVDDDPQIRKVVGTGLEQGGFEVWTASTAEQASEMLDSRGVPSLALIDIGLPETSGVELAQSIKAFSDVPIVMLTAVSDAKTIVDTLNEFAEDYVTKPVLLPVLVARVRRVLARIQDSGCARGPAIHVDHRLVVELTHHRILVDGREESLTPTESKLLHILLRNAGRTVRSDFLLGRLWPMEEVFEDTLRVHVYRLRKKIEEDPRSPRYIVTVRGDGYCFTDFTAHPKPELDT